MISGSLLLHHQKAEICEKVVKLEFDRTMAGFQKGLSEPKHG
jgi:hypothetical protein